MEENSKELKEKLFNQKELGWNSINDREGKIYKSCW